MKKLISLFFTFIMSTTLVFAKSTEMDLISEIDYNFSQMDFSSLYRPSTKDKDRVLKMLDKEIKNVTKRNISTDEELVMLNKKLTKSFESSSKHAKKILSSEKLFNHTLKKIQEKQPEYSKEQLKENLLKLTNSFEFESEVSKTFGEVEKSGSYLQYLKNLKKSFSEEKLVDVSSYQKNGVDRKIAQDMGGVLNLLIIILVILGVMVVLSTVISILASGWFIGLAVGVVVFIACGLFVKWLVAMPTIKREHDEHLTIHQYEFEPLVS